MTAALLLLALAAGPEAAKTADAYEPQVEAASDEPRLALEQVTRPEGVTGVVAAAEPDIANVVAFEIAPDGALYAAETFRQSLGVEDNRSHMDWLEDDLAAQSVADRAAYMKAYFPDDWQEKFATHHDRIRRLTDSNGDGVYDSATVFRTGFNDLVDGTGAGLTFLDGSLYYTCIPDLYRLTDADGDGRAEDMESLSTGYGVRFAFRGHDMHGLTRGPDGKLYWSIGDRGYNVTTREGETIHKPGTGGVFRMNPDGSELELFAYGMRNPQELAWSDLGDLFSVDNNSDSGDLARFIHVMEGSDAGWRMNFQYLEDRGPWNRERMWDPQDLTDETTALQPAYILPPVENFTDGPSGFAAYPGTGFGADFDGRFFISDFRGTAAKSGVRSFRAPQDGAHFKLTDDEQPFWGVLVTDVQFGPDNRFYISDWVDGWNGVGKARLYAFEDAEARQTAASQTASRLIREGMGGRTEAELAGLLASPDRRVRDAAQWALADAKATTLLQTAAQETTNPLVARAHGVWGLGQLAMNGDEAAGAVLLDLLSDDEAEVRTQAARALSWRNKPSDRYTDVTDAESAALLAMLAGEAREAAAAAIAYGQLAAVGPITDEAAAAYMDLADRLAGDDPAVRHAVAFGLSQIGRFSGGTGLDGQIARAAQGRTEAARRAAVVALRRLESPLLAAFLADASPKVATEAARAIHDEDQADAADALSKVSLNADTPDALARRVISANYRTNSPDAVARLLAIAGDATLTGDAEAWRSTALDAVNEWAAPGNLDLVDGSYRPLGDRDAATVARIVADALPSLLDDAATRSQAVKVAGTYGAESAAGRLRDIAADGSLDATVRVAAMASLDQIGDADLATLADRLLADGSGKVRSEARRLITRLAPERAVAVLAEAIESGELAERQAAVRSLAAIGSAESGQTLRAWLTKLTVGEAPEGLALDLIEAAEAGSDEAAKDAAAAYLTSLEGGLTAQYAMCLTGGDAEAGAEVFFGRAAASCRRCHVVNGEGAAVGPDLSEIGKTKDRRYLLEAIMEPNAQIAEGFATKVLVLYDGRVVSGIVREETDETLTLVKPTGELLTVPVDDIDAEAEGQSGMPADLYKGLTRGEIRDLVEYLTTLTERKDPEGHGEE